MKIQGSKKTALIILLTFVGIFSVILILVLYQAFAKKYPEEPIKMNNFGLSTQNLDLSELKQEEIVKDTPLYFVPPKIHISLVEEMIDSMGLSLEREDIVEDSYIVWKDEENSFTYDSVQDTVTFQISRRVSLERGESSFKSFFSKYLGLDYEFILSKEKKNVDGGVTYYGSRLLGDIPVQFGTNYEYSDILKFNDQGTLESGKLLLIEVEKYDYYIPIISESELEKYVNVKTYPKEHYVDSSVLGDLLDISYLDDEWMEIEDSLSECKAGESNLIYMFKNSNQGYLLPALKIYANCKVQFEDNEYTVPATFYVNAVDPRYVSL